MKGRCYNPNDKRYNSYGARGITVCDEWKNDFEAFQKWAESTGYRPDAKRGECTIDRIDNNKSYSPENCRWVNNQTQANNKSNNIILTYNGKSQTISQWARELSVDPETLRHRYNCGWNTKRIIETPLRKKSVDISY